MQTIKEDARMLSQQRQQRILDLMRRNKSAQVTELSDHVGVSVSTVRRDLSELEERGFLQRVHGGAILSANERESPLNARTDAHAEEKARIGAAAANLVQEGETIIITAGTTTGAMLPFLAGKNNLTVITNVIKVAYQLAETPHIAVVVLGGWLRHSEYSLLGHLTHESLRDLRASKIFHGTFGINPSHGLTGTDMQEVETDRRLIDAADQLIVLADSSKFNHIGPIRLAPIETVSMLITDREVSEQQLQPLREHGVEIILT